MLRRAGAQPRMTRSLKDYFRSSSRPSLWQRTLLVPHSNRSGSSSSSFLCVGHPVSSASPPPHQPFPSTFFSALSFCVAHTLLLPTLAFVVLFLLWQWRGPRVSLQRPAEVNLRSSVGLSPWQSIPLGRGLSVKAPWVVCLPVFVTEKPGLQKEFWSSLFLSG